MSDIVERLRDKTKRRAAHGLTGWVLAEEARSDEAADEIERLRKKLGMSLTAERQCDAMREALCLLLPGLVLDLRHADQDDDKEAMRSRIRTVVDALKGVEAPDTESPPKAVTGNEP